MQFDAGWFDQKLDTTSGVIDAQWTGRYNIDATPRGVYVFPSKGLAPMALNFKPENSRMEKILGPLEKELMGILWRASAPLTGREIFESLRQHRRVAYTTVLTVLERLVPKELVIKDKVEGRYLYSATSTQEEFTAQVSRNVLAGLMELSPTQTVAAMVDLLDQQNPAELQALMDLIQQRQAEK